MKSLLTRRRHVGLDDALIAMSDPEISIRDAIIMWRKALRRTQGPTKRLLTEALKRHAGRGKRARSQS